MTFIVSVAGLRASSLHLTETVVALLGYYAPNDGGHGTLVWDAASTDHDDGGLVIKPASVAGAGRWRRQQAGGELNIKWFGAIGDRDSHPLSDHFGSLAAAQAIYPHATNLTNEVDWVAIQAAINSLEVSYPDPKGGGFNVRGGTVYVPRGLFLCDQPVDATVGDRFGIAIRGCGTQGGMAVSKAGGSGIVYTGAGDRFVDARSTYAFTMENLSVIYNNRSFAGTLVDFAHKSPVEVDTQFGTLRNCTFTGDPISGGIPEGTGAKCLVSLRRAICCLIDNCGLGIAKSALRFREVIANSNAYSNAHVVSNCQFFGHRWSLVNAGEQITVHGCTFEGTGGKLEHAYYDDIPRTVISDVVRLTFDAAAKTIARSAGSWIADGWAIGMNPLFFEEAGPNVHRLPPIEKLTATVMTVAAVSSKGGVSLTDEVTNSGTLYVEQPSPATPAAYAPTTFASIGVILTFAGNSVTRSSGSWIDDNWQVGLTPSFTTAKNSLLTPPIESVTRTVLTIQRTGTPPFAFADETATSGEVFFQVGCGPFVFTGNWLGDQSRADNWLEFNQTVGAITIVGNSFVGNRRVAAFNRGGSGIHIAGNHLITVQEALWFGGGGASAVSITGNEVGGKIIAGPAQPGLELLMAGNNSDLGTDEVIINNKLWTMRNPLVLMPGQKVDRVVGGFGSFALQITQGSSAAVGLGAGTREGTSIDEAYLQSFGNIPLNVNAWGGHTIINARNNAKCGIGLNAPTSVLHVAGPIATAYKVCVVNPATHIYDITDTDSFIALDAKDTNVTATLPTAVGCPGREYTLKRVDDGTKGHTASVAANSGQTIDGAPTPYPLATPNSAVVVVSNNDNWLIKSKL